MCITEKASRGSKNLFRGQFCEERALFFYQERGFICKARRLKTPYAELDLVLLSPDKELYIVEVKSVVSEEFISHCLTDYQKKRLQRAHRACSEKWGEIILELAVVSQSGEVLIIPDVFG